MQARHNVLQKGAILVSGLGPVAYPTQCPRLIKGIIRPKDIYVSWEGNK